MVLRGFLRFLFIFFFVNIGKIIEELLYVIIYEYILYEFIEVEL